MFRAYNKSQGTSKLRECIEKQRVRNFNEYTAEKYRKEKEF